MSLYLPVLYMWYIYTKFRLFSFTLWSNIIVMKVSVAFITLILFPYSLSLPSCDKVCPENQVYSSKVSQCQNTCWNRKFNETSKCQTLPGCKCKFGYLRHPDSYECIPESTCPQKTNQVQCGKNEFYSICKNSLRECEKTCDTKNGDLKNCSCKNGCTCKDGYVRSSVTFQCIPKSDCTSMNNFLFLICRSYRIKNINFIIIMSTSYRVPHWIYIRYISKQMQNKLRRQHKHLLSKKWEIRRVWK